MAMTLAGFLRQRHFDANANPLAGGKLYTYQAGTTTPQATYTDSSGGTPNANPVVLDSSGYAAVWLDPALSYKFVLKDSSDVVQWTTDNVVGLLTADAVNTASLQNLCVTTGKIADDAVTAAKLADDASVDGNRAVTTNHIRDANVTRAKLASGAVAAETVTASKTANYTATNADDVIPCSASGGAFTVTLYAASGNSGRRITIKKTDSSFNAVTIDANASETIDGLLTRQLAAQYDWLVLVCDGSNWIVVDGRTTSEVRLHTHNGYGSTSTVIPRFTTTVRNIGAGITYADSATLGSTFTINESGYYSISFSQGATDGSGICHCAISLNSAELTTVGGSITAASRLSGSTYNGSTWSGGITVFSTHWEGYLVVGDVIRPHASTNVPTTAGHSSFTISKVR